MSISIVTAFIIAILLSIIITYGFRRHGPSPLGGLLYFFLIIFLFTWAIGSWIDPMSATFTTYPWLSYFFLGLVITLLLLAIIPSGPPRRQPVTDKELGEQIRAEQAAGATFGLFFWILMIALIALGLGRWILV